MSTITLAFDLEINDELSEEVLASITAALVKGLSKDASKTVAKVAAENGICYGSIGAFNIKALEDLEAAKDGARVMLEAVAAHYEERADVHDTEVLIALAHNPTNPDELKDIHIESGIAGGFKSAAIYARDVIDAL